MQKILKNKNILIVALFIVVIVLLVGGSYQSGASHSSAKKECSSVAEGKVRTTKFYGFGEEAEKARDYDAYYQQCMHQQGL